MLFLRGPGIKWVYRANPATEDKTLADFITDGDYHDMSFSSIIDKNTQIMLVYMKTKNDGVGNPIKFRRKGETSINNIAKADPKPANTSTFDNLWLPVNKDGLLQYDAADVVWATINMTVRGWFV